MKLFLYEPTVVFAARANQASFQFPISQITYDTVTTGGYTDIGNSMTLRFGSTAGADDLGSSRIRLDPTSSILYFGLSSQGVNAGECNPTDNCYLTVVAELRVFSKPPYIDADGEIYMDGGIAYTDQNDEPPPCANAGPPAAGTINPSTNLLTVAFSATASFATAPGATISTYLWDVADGTITVGTSGSSTITATFPGGFRYVRLTVTDSSSKQHNAYVPVLAIDPDDDPTIEAFQITRHTITPAGQELDVRLLADVSTGDWSDGGLLIIIDGEPADASDRSNILFWGWGDMEDASIDATETGVIRDTVIHCLDVAGKLKQLPGYSQVMSHAVSPATWAEMDSPNLDRFIHWLLYHQSTALALADFTWSGTAGAYAFVELIADGSNLWDQVDRRAQSMLPDRRLTCNRLGQLAIKSDPLIQETGSRTLTSQATLSIEAIEQLSFTQYRRPRVAWMRANAMLASNTIIEPLFSIAPGTTPGQGENQSASIAENIAVSQNALNAAAGHHYARLNAPQGLFTLRLPYSDNSAFDPARMDWVTLTLTPEVAAQRGLNFTEARFLLHQLDIRYTYGRGGTVRTNTLRLERETAGIPAVTEAPTVAEPPDVDDFIPPPYVPDPAFDNGLPVGQNVVGVIDRRGYIWTCSDFTTATPPTWSRNTSAAGAVSFSNNDVLSFVVDPFSPGYRGLGSEIRGYVVTGTNIYRVSDLFGTPAYTSLHTLAVAASGAAEHATIACSFGRYESVEADNPWLICAYHASVGSNPLRTYVVYSRDAGDTWSSAIDVSGFTRTSVQEEISRPAVWMSPRTPGLAYVGAWTSTGTSPDGGLYVTTDWGATWAAATAIDDSGIGMGLGFSMHVPWPDNADEAIAYYGGFDRTSNIFNYSLWRSVAGTATDISPVDGAGDTYGPVRGLFSVRTLDTDRQHVLLAGVTDDVDDIAVGVSGSDGLAAIWKSSDAGTTWTRVTTDVATGPTDDAPLQVAFSADDPDVFYIFGLGGYLAYTADGGSTLLDKSPVSPINTALEFLGIFGGS